MHIGEGSLTIVSLLCSESCFDGISYEANQGATLIVNGANKIIPPSMKKATFGL